LAVEVDRHLVAQPLMAAVVVALSEMALVQHIQTALVVAEQQALVAQQLPQPHFAQLHQQRAVRSKVALAQDTQQQIMKAAAEEAVVSSEEAVVIAMARNPMAAAVVVPVT
jgi:Mg-chelatase subunit ChlI